MQDACDMNTPAKKIVRGQEYLGLVFLLSKKGGDIFFRLSNRGGRPGINLFYASLPTF